MSSASNRSIEEDRPSKPMEDLAEILRNDVLPTHLPLIQLIHTISKDPSLKYVDLYSKYIRLAATVGADWITVKDELKNASHFGVPAFYCSVSSMLAIFTCTRSHCHEELVTSLTDLYKHISTGNEILNKQVENAIKCMGIQLEEANKATARITEFNNKVDVAITKMHKHDVLVKKNETNLTNTVKQTDNAINTIKKHIEQVNRAETSMAKLNQRVENAISSIDQNVKHINDDLTNVSLNDANKISYNKDVIAIPGTSFRCKYGVLSIDDDLQCDFKGNGLEGKSLGLWLTLPVEKKTISRLMNLNHEELIRTTDINLENINNFKHNFDNDERCVFMDSVFSVIFYKPKQWCYI